MLRGLGDIQLVRSILSSVGALFPSVIDMELETARESGWRIDPPDAYCHRCGATTGPGEATKTGCSHCRVKPAKANAPGTPAKAVRPIQTIRWDHMLRLCAYHDCVSAWIVEMKYARRWRWASWFGRELAKVIRDYEKAMEASREALQTQPQSEIQSEPQSQPQSQTEPHTQMSFAPDFTLSKQAICYVPMPWSRRWKRGFNQARLIAKVVAKELELPLTRILRRDGWQHPQTHVTPSDREANVRDAFVIEPVDLTGWDIWLIDDVKTTGATLNACCRLLKEAGVNQIRCAVVAVADPKGADFKVV